MMSAACAEEGPGIRKHAAASGKRPLEPWVGTKTMFSRREQIEISVPELIEWTLLCNRCWRLSLWAVEAFLLSPFGRGRQTICAHLDVCTSGCLICAWRCISMHLYLKETFLFIFVVLYLNSCLLLSFNRLWSWIFSILCLVNINYFLLFNMLH